MRKSLLSLVGAFAIAMLLASSLDSGGATFQKSDQFSAADEYFGIPFTLIDYDGLLVGLCIDVERPLQSTREDNHMLNKAVRRGVCLAASVTEDYFVINWTPGVLVCVNQIEDIFERVRYTLDPFFMSVISLH